LPGRYIPCARRWTIPAAEFSPERAEWSAGAPLNALLAPRAPKSPNSAYTSCVPQVNNALTVRPEAESIDQIQAAFQIVAGSITQARVHERLLRSAGVRLDRAGSSLLHKLHTGGDSLRVTDLAELLGVDPPTVTRKIQQLEREQLVSRHPDPDDRRAFRISLTPAGKASLKSVMKARREWFERLVVNWDADDLTTFASLLGRFSSALQQDDWDTRDR
jgi:DNA-binding MarR family transcriptional regulator